MIARAASPVALYVRVGRGEEEDENGTKKNPSGTVTRALEDVETRPAYQEAVNGDTMVLYGVYACTSCAVEPSAPPVEVPAYHTHTHTHALGPAVVRR